MKKITKCKINHFRKPKFISPISNSIKNYHSISFSNKFNLNAKKTESINTIKPLKVKGKKNFNNSKMKQKKNTKKKFITNKKIFFFH